MRVRSDSVYRNMVGKHECELIRIATGGQNKASGGYGCNRYGSAMEGHTCEAVMDVTAEDVQH